MTDTTPEIERVRRAGMALAVVVSLALLLALGYLLVVVTPDTSVIAPWRFTTLATLGAVIVYQYVSLQVNQARRLHRVPLPQTTGPEHFNRVYRVHMNTLENMPLFLPLLWLFAAFWGDAWAGAFGACWVAARFLYAWGYYRAVPLRVCGFGISSTVNLAMLVACLYGAISGLF